MAQTTNSTNDSSIDLVLIGKTGSGKSSTGNAILRRPKSFTIGYSTKSETKVPQYEWGEFEGRTIQVVDSPGIMDTFEDETGGITMVQTALQNVILANPKGYHAFVIVLKFSSRFTREEQKTIDIYKGILGMDFLKDFGIIVMSNGDTFEHHCEADELNLETFCADEKGPFKEILKECNNRIVVFNNITQDENLKHKQVKQLIDMVDKLKDDGRRYTNEQFQKADQIYQYIIATSKIPIISKDMLKEQSLISLEINKSDALADPKARLDSLKSLEPRIKKLIKDLNDLDKTNGTLNMFIKNVEGTEKIVGNRIKTLSNIITQQEKLQKDEERLQKEENELQNKIKACQKDKQQTIKFEEQLAKITKEKQAIQQEKDKLKIQISVTDKQESVVKQATEEKRKDLHGKSNKNFFNIFTKVGSFLIKNARTIIGVIQKIKDLTDN
ncbi:GTPase IMAP family member 7-like [Physella acuta]|uniref:GTPase IMAP family member 7-like n=1 Tax=Physella acuta TaxID=109671 RepID=UPI0027DD3926|nr:GTPase IMAP family member 7-like [Physella acuta]